MGSQPGLDAVRESLRLQLSLIDAGLIESPPAMRAYLVGVLTGIEIVQPSH
jgi:hypothetical protein